MILFSNGSYEESFDNQQSFLTKIDKFDLAGVLHESKKNPAEYLHGIYLLCKRNEYFVAKTARDGQIGNIRFRADISSLTNSGYVLEDFVVVNS